MAAGRKWVTGTFLTCILLFQIFFLCVVFFFYNEFIFESNFFHQMTEQELDWLMQTPREHHLNAVHVCILVRNLISVVSLSGIIHLLIQRGSTLPIQTFWKAAIPVGGLLAYLPCFYYIKYFAEHYRLFMKLVPAEFLSLVLLGLLLTGLWEQRRMSPRTRTDSPALHASVLPHPIPRGGGCTVGSRNWIIRTYVICIVLFQIFFGCVVFFFYEELTFGSTFFRHLTYEEWKWIIQDSREYHLDAVNSCMLIRDFISVINLTGIIHLLIERGSTLPIRTFWKAAIPVGGLLAYLPCFYFIKYHAEHYRLFMRLVPAEFLSLVLLGLLLAGFWEQRRVSRRMSTEG